MLSSLEYVAKGGNRIVAGNNIIALSKMKSEMFKRIYFVKTDGKMEIAFTEDKDNCTHAKVTTLLIRQPLQAHFHTGGEVYINNINGIAEAIGLTEILLDKVLWNELIQILSQTPDSSIRDGQYEISCVGYCWLFVDFYSREDLIGFIMSKRWYWKEQLEAMKDRMIATPKSKEGD